MALMAILWVMPFYEHLWLSAEAINLASHANWGSFIPYHPAIYFGLLAAWLVITLGLLLFKPIARTAFVAMQAIMIIATLFWGFQVLPPVAAALNELVVLLDGAILAMLFLTSVAGRFEHAPNK